MDVITIVSQLGGQARASTVRRLTSKRAVARALAESRVVRVRKGVLGLPQGTAGSAAARAAHGAQSHLSAALVHGWGVKKAPGLPMVTVPRNRKLTPERRALMRVFWAVLTEDELASGVTAPARTVVDCARDLPFDEALCVADSALRSGMVSQAELSAAAAGIRLGKTAMNRVLAAADARAANPFESVLRAIALDVPGLAAVPQLQAGDFRVDLGDPHLRLVIEAESWEFHGTKDGFEKDVRRYTQLAREGWTVIRFLWDDVVNHPDQVRSAIADVVALCERATCCRGCRGGMTP